MDTVTDEDRARLREKLQARDQDGLTATMLGMVFRYTADQIEEASRQEMDRLDPATRHWWDDDCDHPSHRL